MATSAVQATFEFTDGETYSLTLSPLNPSSTTPIKSNFKAFNASISGAAYSNTFVSTAGAALVGIKDAKITTTENTYFYDRGAE